jgi:uncharacterized membrane protein YhaH (DUF805 family)
MDTSQQLLLQTGVTMKKHDIQVTIIWILTILIAFVNGLTVGKYPVKQLFASFLEYVKGAPDVAPTFIRIIT